MKTIDELVLKALDGGIFLGQAVELLESSMITEALSRTAGNQTEASKILGIHRNTLQRKMTEYNIDGRRKKPMGRVAGSDCKPAKRRA